MVIIFNRLICLYYETKFSGILEKVIQNFNSALRTIINLKMSSYIMSVYIVLVLINFLTKAHIDLHFYYFICQNFMYNNVTQIKSISYKNEV